jgi:hypothetical protein
MTTTATALSVIDRGAVPQLQSRMQLILDVMATALEMGKDYGRIPGTGDKPTLYKSGAEKLLLTFSLAAGQPTVADLSTADDVRYRLTVPIASADGRILAVGIGEASSNEEKYRWRKPICDDEYADTPASLRRERWFKGSPPYKGKQIRTSPADVANTILKMSHKRALIHATLLATGASSVFNQDLEDFTKELRDSLLETEEAPTTTTAAPVKPAAAAPHVVPHGAVLITKVDVPSKADIKAKAFVFHDAMPAGTGSGLPVYTSALKELAETAYAAQTPVLLEIVTSSTGKAYIKNIVSTDPPLTSDDIPFA